MNEKNQAVAECATATYATAPEEAIAQRVLARGTCAITDAELVALVGGVSLDTARAAITEAGGLRGVCSTPPLALRVGLLAAQELSLRLLASRMEAGELLNDPAVAGRYFSVRLRSREREVFAVAFLNVKHRLIATEELFYGTLDGAEIHPREVVKRALELGASAILIAHNHPSGSPEPSAADRAVTNRLKQALALVDIRLLDHFIIGDGPPTSMAEKGFV